MKKSTKSEAIQRQAAEDMWRKTAEDMKKTAPSKMSAEAMQSLRRRGWLIVCVTTHQKSDGSDIFLRIEHHDGAVEEQGRIPGPDTTSDRRGAILTSYLRSLTPAVEEIYPNWSGLERLRDVLWDAGWILRTEADQHNVAVFEIIRRSDRAA